MQLNNTQAKKMQETLLTWIEALKRSSRAVLLVLATAVLLPAQTQAQSMAAAQVTLPNGYLNLRSNDLVVSSAMGPMRWTQEWDSHEGDKGDEKKVNAALKLGRNLGNWGLSNNCQMFVHSTLLEAGYKLPTPPPVEE
ncbi:hypothetical protein [Verminephrobacter aporrectodeae]|uniref:hypothetical protein n=1 Tax=Verminephrobacter aporrectodeae TaxID=1110389 RepID=UPI0022439DB0|nr:hypothetical protein [Verminephrobacter aporrectodeae]MCW8177156.1 hypothetical protein [Verminephrobacter aporrectodeae subsp. tuberculatae]MCW8204601.1 hypothetical protein [Verminephrobacter aporrectodeae subsp. tuberculatae]